MTWHFEVYSPKAHPTKNKLFFPFGITNFFSEFFCGTGKKVRERFIGEKVLFVNLLHSRNKIPKGFYEDGTGEKVLLMNLLHSRNKIPKGFYEDGTGEKVLLPNVFKTVCAESLPMRLKHILPLAFFGFLLLSSVGTPNPWWSDSWAFRIPIDVSDAAGVGTSDDYILVNISSPQLNATRCGREIRLLNENNQVVNSTVVFNASDSCGVSFSMSIPVGGSQRYYIYYGNPSALDNPFSGYDFNDLIKVYENNTFPANGGWGGRIQSPTGAQMCINTTAWALLPTDYTISKIEYIRHSLNNPHEGLQTSTIQISTNLPPETFADQSNTDAFTLTSQNGTKTVYGSILRAVICNNFNQGLEHVSDSIKIWARNHSTTSRVVVGLQEWLHPLPAIKAALFNGSTTNFSGVTDFSNISNLTLENTEYGKMAFLQQVNLSGGADFDANIEISSNKISVNSGNLPALNKQAVLALYNLSFSNPRIMKDGVVCPDTICTKLDYSGGSLIFNVTGFSSYSAEETPQQPTSSASDPMPAYSGGGSGGSYFAPPKKEFEIFLIQPQKEVIAGNVSVKFAATINSTDYCYVLLDGRIAENLTGGESECLLEGVSPGTHSLYIGCADDSGGTAHILSSFYARAPEIAEETINDTIGEKTPQATAVTGFSILSLLGDNYFLVLAFVSAFVCVFAFWKYQPEFLQAAGSPVVSKKEASSKPAKAKQIAEARLFAESFSRQKKAAPEQVERPILLQQICRFFREYREEGGEKINFTVPEIAAKVGATPLAVRTAAYRGLELGVLDKYQSGRFRGFRLGKHGLKAAEMENFRSYGDFEKALEISLRENN